MIMRYHNKDLTSDQEQVLAEACEVHNITRRNLNAAHVDLTPQQYLDDIIARYIEGLRPATAQDKALAEQARIKVRAARERLGLFGPG